MHADDVIFDHLDHLDHLDDPDPFVVDDGFRRSVTVAGTRRRRRRRLLTSTGSAVLVVGLLATGLAGWGRWQAGRVERISIAAVPQVDAQGNPVTADLGPLDQPFTLLVIGNDHAPDQGRPETNMTDTIMIVRVDRPAGQVRVLSIPRDLYVAIDGQGQARINAARHQGYETLIRTINRTFGITVDHYAESRFDGFEHLVDAMGGIPLQFDTAVRDPSTGLAVDAGCHVLDGRQALALARSRHFEVLTSGRWQADPTGDLGRIRRQQVLGEAAARHAGLQSLTAGGLLDLGRIAPESVTLDDRLGISDLLGLAGWVAGLPRDAVTTMTPKVTRRITPGGADVLELESGAAEQARAFIAGTPVALAPNPSTAQPAPSTAVTTTTATAQTPDVVHLTPDDRC